MLANGRGVVKNSRPSCGSGRKFVDRVNHNPISSIIGIDAPPMPQLGLSSDHAKGMENMRNHRAFTLTELLVVIGVIALLIGIILPALDRAKDLANRTACANNVRQMVQIVTNYAQDYDRAGAYYNPVVTDDEAIDISYLYPQYLRDVNLVICPSTLNTVDVHKLDAKGKPKGLDKSARSASQTGSNDPSGNSDGYSYTFVCFINQGVTFPDGYCYNGPCPSGSLLPKTLLNAGNKSKNLLFMDEMRGTTNNWPMDWSNHGIAGINAGFCDGHVQWLARGRPILQAYMDGHYKPDLDSYPDGLSESAFFTKYGLSKNGEVYTWLP